MPKFPFLILLVFVFAFARARAVLDDYENFESYDEDSEEMIVLYQRPGLRDWIYYNYSSEPWHGILLSRGRVRRMIY
jgi:hypothetical protein